MILITLITILIASILAFISEYLPLHKSKLLYVLMGISLIIVAGFRDGQRMPDYETYEGMYYVVVSDSFSYFIEISFIYIAKLSSVIVEENPVALFIIYAIIGVTLKLFSIKKLSNLYFYSLVIYTSNYFILHEMIQIRAGVATAFILLSIVSVYNRNLKHFFFLIGCATLFHYSSIVFLFLWFLRKNSYNKYLYFSLIPIAYLIHFTLDPLSLIVNYLPFDLKNLKMDIYTDESRAKRLEINVLGIFILTRMIILVYFTSFANLIKLYNKYFFILLKCYAFGIFIYIAFAKYPEISVRICYTLLVSEIIIIPTLLYTIKGHYLPRVILVLYGLLAFILNVYFTTYFNYSLY